MNSFSGFLILATAVMSGDPELSNVLIAERFKPYLVSNPLLMEVTGAKIIRRKSEEFVILSVSSTVLRDDSPIERLRAERVCRARALANVVAEREGIQIARVEVSQDRTKVIIENGKERATSVANYLEVTKATVEGITQNMPVIGRWESKNGMVYYLAIGAVCDKTGKVARESTTVP